MMKFLYGIFLVFSFFAASDVLAKSWSETIVLVEKRADALWEKGISYGAETNLGTAVNELDIPRHTCTILGRLLGQVGLIEALEYDPEPILSAEPNEDELRDLMLYAHSLSNWVFVARTIVKLDENERKKIWNLDCSGRMGIASFFFEVESRSASFALEGTDLRVLGKIEAGFHEELKKWLDSSEEVTRVVLGSGGGNVGEAVAAGMLIRGRKLDTTLSANCFSACPIVFLGGVNRTIWSPYPNLGFHQMSGLDGQPIRTSDEAYSILENYATLMGADASFFLASMLRAAPNEMFEPDLNDLCKHNITTWIQRLCF